MAQVSAQPHDDDNPSRRDSLLLRGPLLVARSFEGLTAEPLVGVPRRRRGVVTGGPDPESSSASSFPLRLVEPPLQEDEDPTHAPAQLEPRVVVDLTVNRICRIITILVLGFWGGWSPMPAESRVPVSAAWVSYICIITDWIVLATNLDCMCPTAMDWYFRWGPQWWLPVKAARPQVTVTGYSILTTLVGLGIAIFKYIFRNDQPVLTGTDVIAGSLIFVCLYWLGRVEGKAEHSGAWFFHNDYGPRIWTAIKYMFSFFRIVFALLSWWWIFFRIVAIVNILRNRGQREMALQFLTLAVGLGVESVLLCWFFSIPFLPRLFNWAKWDRGLWYGHLPPLLAMLAAWVMVVVIGLREGLPNILFPCSGSTSMVCSVLIKYAY